MKNVVLFVLAAGLGAAAVWGFQSVSRQKSEADGRDSRPSEEVAMAPGPVLVQPLVARPAPDAANQRVREAPFFAGDASTVDAGQPVPVPAPARLVTARSDTAPYDAVPYNGGALVRETGLEQDRRLARATFDTGERDLGIRQLQAVYAAAKDRPDVDLSGEVERLLASESRLEQRRQYSQYLARYDRTGRVLHKQLKRAAEKVAEAEKDTEAAIAAWDELTIAYRIATDRLGRQKVLAQVKPFIDRMILSGRYTPLLKTYTVQSGDSLSEIAATFQATTDGLRRINGLKNDAIQPRMRLRILTGKLKIYVDKSDFTLSATIDDRIFLEFPIGTGRNNATPVGTFVVQTRQKDPTWWRPGASPIPAGDERNILGVRWLGFEDTPQHVGFGIHGTKDPSSLGKESSAGCIRMRNEDIELLYDFVRFGTDVVVRN